MKLINLNKPPAAWVGPSGISGGDLNSVIVRKHLLTDVYRNKSDTMVFTL